MEQLARVVPFIDGVSEVDAFVALQPDEPRAEHVGHDLRGLSLADARLALDEERLFELQGKEYRRGEAAVADIAALAKASLDVVDARRSSHDVNRLPTD